MADPSSSLTNVATKPVNILIVGYGEIARLAHLPVLESRRDAVVLGLVDPKFSDDEGAFIPKDPWTRKQNCESELGSQLNSDHHNTTTAKSFNNLLQPLKFTTVKDAFEYFHGDIQAVSICTPKSATISVAWGVIKFATSKSESQHSMHHHLIGIFLEKPPGEDASELQRLVEYGTSRGISMFTGCHTTVCPARQVIDSWLFGDKDKDNNINPHQNCDADEKVLTRTLESINITWKENVRKWHPGHSWISKESGGGVTDMLFNPLSLVISIFGLTLEKTKHSLPDSDRISDEVTNHERSVTLMKANLVRPCNWEAPISGMAELLTNIPYKDQRTCSSGLMKVPIFAEFAFDYEPACNGGSSNDCEKGEEVWDIEFFESFSGSNGIIKHNCLKVTEGGAQAFIGSQKMTSEPTADYPLQPEYVTLYDQFFELLQRNEMQKIEGAGKSSLTQNRNAPSIVDCTTMDLLKELLQLATYTDSPRFDF